MIQQFLNNLDFAANVIEVLTLIFSIGAWVQASRLNKTVRDAEKRRNKEIAIKLVNGNNQYELPVKLKGDDFTRAEILGQLGMIPINPKKAIDNRSPRFSLSNTSTFDFMREIKRIQQETESSILTIPCTNEEFQQFEFSKIDEK